MTWQAEIAELHAFFEQYFLGLSDSLTRAEQALAPDFTIVGADGVEQSRAATMTNLSAGHSHTDSLKITTHDYRLIAETDDLIVANYVETHELRERSNHRRSTVVFRRFDAAPHGLHWIRVHETWIADSPS